MLKKRRDACVLSIPALLTVKDGIISWRTVLDKLHYLRKNICNIDYYRKEPYRMEKYVTPELEIINIDEDSAILTSTIDWSQGETIWTVTIDTNP